MAREIPKSEWPQFLSDFTVDQEGRKAVLEVDGKCIGCSEGDDAFVLTGVEAGVQAEDDDTIVVALADMEGREQHHVSHRLEDVTTIRLREQEGRIDGLEFETEGGSRGHLRLEGEIPVTA
ncbi:MAG: DUF5335 family protein [Armatimonadetes bacterium]|jgi:hypothetical protein|nr:DUF5335 family protein [Armatimonadota bacterium]